MVRLELDWKDSEEVFMGKVDAFIGQCAVENRAFTIPFFFGNGISNESVKRAILDMVDCSNCDARCCIDAKNVKLSYEEWRAFKTKVPYYVWSKINPLLREDGGYLYYDQPCPLLKDGRCSVYEHRFSPCSMFPIYRENEDCSFSVSALCPEVRRIGREVYLSSYRYAHKEEVNVASKV